MMGSGKTAVGQALARRLGWRYRDNDQQLQIAVGAAVDEVAKVTVRAALTAKPKTRYRVGKGANLVVAMATMLPDRTFDKLTSMQFGYGRSA